MYGYKKSEPAHMMRLKLDEQTEEKTSNILTVAIILAAIATLPLTMAYWFEWEGLWVTIGDWTVWSVFVIEYAFYMAISRDRWQTTKNQWMSVIIILFSFPLLHELLQATRLIRLVRPVPLLRQAAVMRQIELMRLSNVRSAGSQTAIREAKEKLGSEHWAVKWIVWFEFHKSRIISWVLGKLPFVSSRKVEQSEDDRDAVEAEKSRQE